MATFENDRCRKQRILYNLEIFFENGRAIRIESLIVIWRKKSDNIVMSIFSLQIY